MTCPACGASVGPGARFCSSCGQPLVLRADERRVVTVVFVDVVGFTTFSETMDPEQVKRVIHRTFDALASDVQSFGGLVDKVVGDAMVALFGAPTAHEDDAERAVRAALRMQDTVAELSPRSPVPVQVRIGVNTGEVLVGATRAGGDYTAMGDVVNTAQRLQTVASPGEVVVGPATHAVTVDTIRYETVGEVRAKGREAPVMAWRAVAPTAPPGRRPRRVRTPLVGRSDEVALIDHTVALGSRHGRAQLVVLEGEAGVGKSRLAEEAAAVVRQRHGARVLEGHCLPYGEPNQFWPIASALQAQLQVHGGMDHDVFVATVRSRVDAAMTGHLGRAVDPLEADRVTQGLVALLGRTGPGGGGPGGGGPAATMPTAPPAAPVSGGAAVSAGSAGIDPGRARDEITRSVVAYCEALTRTAPLVLAVSDLHWADELVLDLLGRLLVKLGSQPFTVLATLRGALEDVWSPPVGRHHVVALRLDPLDREAAGALLEAVLGETVPGALAEQLLERSGGNPLFLEELAVVAGQTGDLQLLPALPDTLRGLIVARLDALAPDERAMLDNAAVLGSSGLFSALETFAAALGQPASRAVLRRLGEGDLLDVDGDRWAFRSQAVREVAYQTLTKEARAQRHAGVAMSMEEEGPRADRVAHHWATAAELARELGGQVRFVPADAGERALCWLARAGEAARDLDTHPPVVRLAGRALALLDGGVLAGQPARAAEERRRFLLLRAWGLSGERLLAEAAVDADEALHDARSTLAAASGSSADAAAREAAARDEAAALTLLGTIEQRAGRLDTAATVLDEALAAWRVLGDDEGVASALRSAGMTAVFSYDFAKADAVLREARDLSAAVGDRRGEAWAVQHLAWTAFVLGDTDLADRRLQRAATTFGDIGDVGGLGWALGLLAFVRFQQGRLDEAATIAEEVRREASERGDTWGLGMMLVLLSGLQLWKGRPDESVELATEARAQFQRIGDRFGEAQALVPLARAHLAAGRAGDARRTLEACRSAAEVARLVPVADVLALAMAVWQGDLGRVASALATGVAPSHAQGMVHEWWSAVALAALQRGDLDLAARAADELATRPGHPYADACRSLALLAVDADPAVAARLAAGVLAHRGASHVDRLLAGVGAAFAALRSGNAGAARSAIDAARVAVDATADRLAQAVVRLADAEVLAALGSPAAPLARREADLRTAALDVPGTGWSAAFALVAGSSVRAAGPVAS